MDPSAPAADRLHQSRPSTSHDEGADATTTTRSARKDAVAEYARLEGNQRPWRRVILYFEPSWFSVNMGTGVVSILLHNLPYNAEWLYWISVVIFCLNVVLFVLFFIISVLRYTVFPGVWGCMIRHPVQSLFLGTCPMGLATIINMIVFVCVPAWGSNYATLAWALWWIDVVGAVGTCFYLPFIIMYKHEAHLETMTAAWLLPIVPTIVAAATGSIVASVLPSHHAIITIITSYILWGCGVPLALFTIVIYFERLTMCKLPPREVIVSVFLPLGPLGQGAFGIMRLGKETMRLTNDVEFLPKAAVAGQVFYSLGFFAAFILWGFGLVWLFFAVASITRNRFPFNLGWWGFTFPLGVYSTATTTFAQEIPSAFFKVLGTIFSLVVVFLWVVVSTGTIRHAYLGDLFHAPGSRPSQAERKKNDGKRSLRNIV
ncbi:sulfite transporter Ssu1 [Verticillium alfalfae VaMs.102]|uniref:Sulfite efflux pump SSU1 n=1 Tax=Verticillium alfalfae (strain VaMs.102 / ATCC MYA-4576 / FGSC 10136) TaxID=526221 RepID=C9SIP9_VERA1|nr:sulfite transporter Ssu1 [Verticillium alfalfae VaMs.102]EEY18822.1 sulfite transporter Ssu1 [Verticillium alfalfae VaMs.102]